MTVKLNIKTFTIVQKLLCIKDKNEIKRKYIINAEKVTFYNISQF